MGQEPITNCLKLVPAKLLLIDLEQSVIQKTNAQAKDELIAKQPCKSGEQKQPDLPLCPQQEFEGCINMV